MLFRIFLLAIFIPSFAIHANHAIYLSVVEIDNDQISVKVFSDDLQDVIRNYSNECVLSDVTEFVSLNEILISEYFNSNLKVILNGNSRELVLRNFKHENDAYFLYFSFVNDLTWKNIEVEGSYFTELFPDQSNVLNIIKDDRKHFAKLTKSAPTFKISFE